MILFAQSKEIQGIVKDENGQPLPGASIVIKGAAIGASTDFDGKFTINVPSDGEILVISYIGFKSKEVKIDFSLLSEAKEAVKEKEIVLKEYDEIDDKDLTEEEKTIFLP